MARRESSNALPHCMRDSPIPRDERGVDPEMGSIPYATHRKTESLAAEVSVNTAIGVAQVAVPGNGCRVLGRRPPVADVANAVVRPTVAADAARKA